jgi:predicted protein tyrosine phosphatase
MFVCAVNRNRSKAAERICKQLAQAKGREIECTSAGVDPLAERRLTKQMAEKADIIFVMEDYMQSILENDFHQPAGKIICFDIQDVYFINDPVLEKRLTDEIKPYI